MAGDIFGRLTNPQVKANLAPYVGHVQQTAQALGVDPDFVVASIVAESNGIPNAVSDNGKAIGIYQVQTPYLKDYGFARDQRTNPVAATNAIMPTFRKIVDSAGGDWALARAMYMRGQNSPQVQALRKGQPAEKVFAGDPVALSQYRQFKALQAGRQPGFKPPPPEQVPTQQAAKPQAQDAQAQQMAAAPVAVRPAPVLPLPIPVVPDMRTVQTRAPQLVDPSIYLRALGINLGLDQFI